jgi:hypothetical protein
MWFDWRMIPVMLLMLFGFIMAAVGLLLLIATACGFPPAAPPLIGPDAASSFLLTPARTLAVGCGAMLLAAGAAEFCRRNPDAGT